MIKACVVYIIAQLLKKQPELIEKLLDFIKENIHLLSNKVLLESLQEFSSAKLDVPFSEKITEIRNIMLMEYKKRSGIPPS